VKKLENKMKKRLFSSNNITYGSAKKLDEKIKVVRMSRIKFS